VEYDIVAEMHGQPQRTVELLLGTSASP
jgi:hypothetical protein